MKKIKPTFLAFLTAVFVMGCAGNVPTEPFSEQPELGTPQSTVGFTKTAAETTTIDNHPLGHFGVFDKYVLLDGELHAIVTLDGPLALMETEEGYACFYPFDEERLSGLFTDEYFRGATKKVTDEAEKTDTLYLLQNELETDLLDGMKVYFDGENLMLLISYQDARL